MKKLLYLLLLFPAVSNACSCVSTDFEDHIRDSNEIFIGKVISVEEFDGYPYGSSYLRRMWKAVIEISFNYYSDSKQLTVYDSDGCAVYFIKGQEYLVFADITDLKHIDGTAEKILHTSVCHGSSDTRYADKEVSMIKSLKSSGYTIDSITPEKLYGELWKGKLLFSKNNPAAFTGDEAVLTALLEKLGKRFKALRKKEKDQFRIMMFGIDDKGLLTDIYPDSDLELNEKDKAIILKELQALGGWQPASIKGIKVCSKIIQGIY